MNKKGICSYFGYPLKIGEYQKLIKQCGFDCVITNADKKFDFQNGKIGKQIKFCKKYNLQLSSLHMAYHGNDLKKFWQDCAYGDMLEKKLIKDVKIAHRYGFNCVVVHLEGEKSQVGLDRLKRVLVVCKKYNIPLALENIGFYELLKYCFDNIQDDNLKLCFDIGHQNCFDIRHDILDEFGDKLIALHLHSNNGEYDEHTLNKYGNIDWQNFAKKLAKLNPNINLDYEILMHTRHCESAVDVLKEVYSQACELEKMIDEYKKSD